MAFKKSNTIETKEMNYVVEEDYGVISSKGDWDLKLRLVSWNGNDSKYDLRAWKTENDGTEKCRKGLTLTGEEAENLYKLLSKIAKGGN